MVPFLVRPCALLCLNGWMSELQMGSRGDSEWKYHGPLHMIMNDITTTMCSSYQIKNSKTPPGGSYLSPQYWQILRTSSTERLKATVLWIPVSMPWVLTDTTSYEQSWKVKATTLLRITINSETELWWLNTEAGDYFLLIIVSHSQIWSNGKRFHRYEGAGTVTVDRKGG